MSVLLAWCGGHAGCWNAESACERVFWRNGEGWTRCRRASNEVEMLLAV